MSKLPKLTKGAKAIGATIDVTALAGKVLAIKEQDFKHQNEIQSKQYDHDAALDKAEKIMEYRNTVNELTEKERETLTEGFVKALLKDSTPEQK